VIGPGEERTGLINLHLITAQLFLLLVSPDFMASDQCYFKMMRAVESCDAKENLLVFPILLRPVDYQDAPFSEFQILPDGCEPITTSPKRDETYQKIVEVIWESVEAILLLHWTEEAYAYEKAERYEDALFAYEQAVLLRPQEWWLYSSRGFVLRALGHSKDALIDFNRAIRLDPTSEMAQNSCSGTAKWGEAAAISPHPECGDARPLKYVAGVSCWPESLVMTQVSNWWSLSKAYEEVCRKLPVTRVKSNL
jgi:tetratricopeptide (TPR) repeat protein